MPNLNDFIEPPVAGDDFFVRKTVDDVPATTTVTKAWLTVKADYDDADPGLVQKAITGADSPGTGHIEVAGAVGTSELRFDLVPADTVAIGLAERLFDVQVKLSNGAVSTPFSGRMRCAKPNVTVTTT
jgi:hypothetical protein